MVDTKALDMPYTVQVWDTDFQFRRNQPPVRTFSAANKKELTDKMRILYDMHSDGSIFGYMLAVVTKHDGSRQLYLRKFKNGKRYAFWQIFDIEPNGT